MGGRRKGFSKKQMLPSRAGRDLGADPGLGIVEGEEVACSRSSSKAVGPHSARAPVLLETSLGPSGHFLS